MKRHNHHRARNSTRLNRLRCALDKGQLRIMLQAAGGESLDAEDMIVRQVQFAGHKRRPLQSIKRFVHAGGMLVLRGTMEDQIRRQIAQLLEDYTLADAVPVHVDFPVPKTAGTTDSAERHIALLLIGPRLKRGVAT